MEPVSVYFAIRPFPKLLLIFAAIITMYVTIIISMYDPKMMETLDSFYEIMPELMAAVGMSTGAARRRQCCILYRKTGTKPENRCSR